MSNLIKHRWFEIRHNPVFWLMFSACCAFALFDIGGGGFSYVTGTPMVAGVTRDWKGLFMNSAADCIPPLLIIGGTLAAMMLSRQFSGRTVDQEVAAGHGRIEILASECAAGFAVPGVPVLISLFAGCLCWAGRLPMPSAPEAAPYFVRVAVLLLLLIFSLSSACIFFVALFRDTAKTTAASALFLTAVCWTMAALEQPLAKIPGTRYPSAPSLPLLLNPVFQMRHVLSAALPPAQVLQAAGVAVGWSALFLGAACCVFRRCELK